MLILAIDSSSNACSVAVARDGVLVARRRVPMSRGHGAALTPMISEALAAARTPAASLDAIAVTTGPGSFTGLRIGLAAAKGLALALDRPLIGISCFDAIERRAAVQSTQAPTAATARVLLVIALESKREAVYVRCLDHDGRALITGEALEPAELAERLSRLTTEKSKLRVVGDAAGRVAPALRLANNLVGESVSTGSTEPPDAVDVALLAYALILHAKLPPESYTPGLEPLYLRPADISTAKQ